MYKLGRLEAHTSVLSMITHHDGRYDRREWRSASGPGAGSIVYFDEITHTMID